MKKAAVKKTKLDPKLIKAFAEGENLGEEIDYLFTGVPQTPEQALRKLEDEQGRANFNRVRLAYDEAHAAETARLRARQEFLEPGGSDEKNTCDQATGLPDWPDTVSLGLKIGEDFDNGFYGSLSRNKAFQKAATQNTVKGDFKTAHNLLQSCERGRLAKKRQK